VTLGKPFLGFPKSRRLLDPAQFREVFDLAVRSSDAHFTILARPNGQSQARLGLAIAKKNIRKASDRNRIKRFIRESFRISQSELAGLDLVVMARNAAGNADHGTLNRALLKHWVYLVKQCRLSCSPSSSSTDT
jgi:ribonuclease P protein component